MYLAKVCVNVQLQLYVTQCEMFLQDAQGHTTDHAAHTAYPSQNDQNSYNKIS